jgi:17beta-estradiol 17-dehydrogenase / very-long-chain 3-oxoacyl-CoA reductase
VSRTQSKLDTVAKEIQEQFNVDTKTIAVNFTAGVEIYEVIKEKIRGLEVGILVNNVGMAYTAPDYFLSVPDREKLIQDMIQCNALSIPMMTNLILPQMVERRRGLIVNISSLSAIVPAGCMSIYSATKAFAHKFSEDLQMEYRKDNIIVQSVLPGPVATNMTKMKKGSWMAPKPDVYVESTLKTVGHADFTTGYYPHMLLNFVVFLFNFVAPEMLAKTTLKTMENVRNRGIKKGFYTPATN